MNMMEGRSLVGPLNAAQEQRSHPVVPLSALLLPPLTVAAAETTLVQEEDEELGKKVEIMDRSPSRFGSHISIALITFRRRSREASGKQWKWKQIKEQGAIQSPN